MNSAFFPSSPSSTSYSNPPEMTICSDLGEDIDVMDVQQQQILDDTSSSSSSSSSSSAPPRPSLKRKEWSSMDEQGIDEFNAHKGMRKRRVFEMGKERRCRAAPPWRSLGDAHDHVFGLDHISYTKENQLLSPLTMLLREGIPAESQLIEACLQEGAHADDNGKEEDATDVEEDGGKASEAGEKMDKDQKETPGEEQQTCTTSVATTAAAAAAAAATPPLSKKEQVLLQAIEAASPMPMIRRGLRLQCLLWRRQHGEKEVAEDEGEDVEEAMAAQTQLVTEVVERHLTRFSPRGPLLFSEDYIATINRRERREAERWARQGGSGNSARTSSVDTTGDAAERRRRHQQMRRRRQRRRRRRLNMDYDDAGSEDDYGFDSHDEDDEGYDDDDNDTADEEDDDEEDEDVDNTPEVNSYETVIVSHDDAESLPPSTTTTTTASSSSPSAFSSSSTLPSGKRRRLQTSPSRAEEGGRADERLFSMAGDGDDTQDDAVDLVPRPPLLNIDPAMEAGTDESDEDTQPMD